MQFFTEHFNTHHLLHHPHKWFLALLVSPIHFAEIHYEKKYHLNFVHAKKLFVFDITLLLLAITLFISTIFWFTYDPTITKLVYLNIKTTNSRVASGNYVEYTINYKNENPLPLISPILAINLPNGFILDQAIPADKFQNNFFTLDNIMPKTTGSVTIKGWIYAIPEQDNHITATLAFKQSGKEKYEEKSTLLIKTLRGSVLNTKIESQKIILPNDNIPIKIIIKNTGEKTLNNITIPLPNSSEIKFVSKDLGQTNITINELKPNEEQVFFLNLITNISDNNKKNIDLNLTPQLEINRTKINQTTLTYRLDIARPKTNSTAVWQNNIEKAKPNETVQLKINLKNTGNINLINPKIELPITGSIVNVEQLKNLNNGTYKNQIFTIPLDNLEINSTKELIINIPINNFPQGGNDLLFSLSPRLNSSLNNITNNYSEIIESPAIKIGTNLLLNPEIRYFTNEGDQLGRGPLPPQVNKETKYWAVINLTNGTSKLSNVNLSVQLPNYIVWTGKTSVTNGSDIRYNAKNNTASWVSNSLSAHENAGIYFELALTPTTEMRGSSPILVQNIAINGLDSYINETVSQKYGSLDITIPDDKIGQTKGIKVE
ncbi:MAG TPA: hypothetical protein DEB09_05370 [Candidatus Magasanikbacteria bacterium]|nr:hypothetical protein [Candidatus Magasanikbacteria bacterium]